MLIALFLRHPSSRPHQKNNRTRDQVWPNAGVLFHRRHRHHRKPDEAKIYQHRRVGGILTLFCSLAEILLVPCGSPLGLSMSRSSRCFRFFEIGLDVDFGLALTEAGIGFGMSKDASSALFLAIRS